MQGDPPRLRKPRRVRVAVLTVTGTRQAQGLLVRARVATSWRLTLPETYIVLCPEDDQWVIHA